MGIQVPLRRDEAYGYGVFALPAFRGRGLSTTVGVARLHWLREQGVRRFYGWVRESNTAMRKVQMRLGYRTVASVRQTYWQIRRRLVLINQVLCDPTDPLAEWCTPGRITFHGGMTIHRSGRVR